MLVEALLPRDDCIVTCPTPAPCACAANQSCFQTGRGCTVCPVNSCVTNGANTGTSKSGGVSKGALAGAIIGTLIFLAAAVSLFLWYRRSNRFRSITVPEVKDVPAPAATVLNRPDPTEKSSSATKHSSVRVYSTSSNTTIDLDPESQENSPHGYVSSRGSIPSNPFDDGNSIQTAGTEGTNVIPIALVSPESHPVSQSQFSGPIRPVRSPDLTLNYNLEHVNVSGDSIRPPAGYALSQISGVSSRNSYMSGASYSSDFLNEAPMIVTANKGAVRQVKPEMVNATTISPTTSEGLKPPPAFLKKPSVRSPLAESSFGPSDVAKDSDDGHSVSDPFSDRHISTLTNRASPSASVTTFGQPSPPPPRRNSENSEWENLNVPWLPDDSQSRPSSMYTQAGSVIGIENATRVNLGMGYLSDETPQTAQFPRSTYRTTMARLVSPSTAQTPAGTLQEQQQSAFARAQAQGGDPSRRISASSVLSAASTRADSILESFPFVPPSPISNRPMRSPPVSPLVQQTFSAAAPSSPLAKQTFTHPKAKFNNGDESDSDLPTPPNRRTLGLSTGSQFSTASSGLGSFPFQIDSGNEAEPSSASSYSGRQRASLDTLAITSDLSSYPLGFDRESSLPYKNN